MLPVPNRIARNFGPITEADVWPHCDDVPERVENEKTVVVVTQALCDGSRKEQQKQYDSRLS